MPQDQERLAPTGLYNILEKIIARINASDIIKWEPSQQEEEIGHLIRPVFHHTTINGRTIVITSPTNDSEKHTTLTQADGGITLKHALETIKRELGPKLSKTTILMPLAQTSARFFDVKLGRRNHWTTLMIYIDPNGNAIVDHYDSQGLFRAAIFSLAHIIRTINEVLGVAAYMRTIYTGHQAITDTSNCGRFCLLYIFSLLCGKENLQELSYTEAIRIFAVFNRIARRQEEATNSIGEQIAGSIRSIYPDITESAELSEEELAEARANSSEEGPSSTVTHTTFSLIAAVSNELLKLPLTTLFLLR